MNDDELAVFRKLSQAITSNRQRYILLDGYYNGAQRLEMLGLAVPPALAQFTTIVNWPRLAVDSIEERLDVTGFRFAGDQSASDELWEIWQANDLDEESQLGHLDALVFKRAFACVGTNEDDPKTPLITVESPKEMEVLVDTRTRKVVAALRLYLRDGSRGNASANAATLYLPDSTVWLERNGEWLEVERDDHGLGEVPVVPIVNRPRTGARGGVSEMADVISLTDAAARAITNAQVASEALAVPQRGVIGASKGDFVDKAGKPLTVWETYFGTVWALENEKAKTFQFDAASLTNFETIVNLYAKQVAAMTGLPPHYLGFTTDNPASADAIRSSEARLVKRCERKQHIFSGSWERVMRLALLFQDGKSDEDARRLETLWRDPATPTKAQQADAVVKLHQARLLPDEAAWEELGYGPEKIANLKRMRAEQGAQSGLGNLRELFVTPPAEDAPAEV